MPGQKISSLNEVGSIEPSDFFVIARQTNNYKVAGSLLFTKREGTILEDALKVSVQEKFLIVSDRIDKLPESFILKPKLAKNKQVLTYVEGPNAVGGWIAQDLPKQLPTSAQHGQVLAYLDGEWVPRTINLPPDLSSQINNYISKPLNSTQGHVLQYNGNAWVSAPNTPDFTNTITNITSQLNTISNTYIPKPAGMQVNDVLMFNGTNWVARSLSIPADLSANIAQIQSQLGGLNFIPKPSGASNNHVLKFNGTSWVSAPQQPDLTANVNSLQNQTNILADRIDSFILKPTPAVTNDILSYNGSQWIANNRLSVLEETVRNNNPIGTVSYFARTTAPAGWQICDGRTILNAQTTYPAFYDAITFSANTQGRTWGRSGSNIILPDLRGEFIRGWDNSKGVDYNRAIGSFQQESTKLIDHRHDLKGDRDSSYYVINDLNVAPPDTGGFRAQGPHEANDAQWSPYTGKVTLDHPQQIDKDILTKETRPRNIALLACIKIYDAGEVGPTFNSAGIVSASEQTITRANEILAQATQNINQFNIKTSQIIEESDYISFLRLYAVDLDDRPELYIQGNRATDLGSGAGGNRVVEISWLPNEKRYALRFATIGSAWTYSTKIGLSNYGQQRVFGLVINNDGGRSHTFRFQANGYAYFKTRYGKQFQLNPTNSTYFNGLPGVLVAGSNYANYEIIFDSTALTTQSAIVFRLWRNTAATNEGGVNWVDW